MATHQIKLYYNSSDKNVLNKTLTELYTITGNFKRPTDIIHPDIEIVYHPDVDWSNCNYIWCELFHRNYFVDSKTYDTFGNITLHCTCDVLTSHKSILNNLDIIANRSSSKFNVYQNDPEIPTLANQVVATQKFPSGFSNNQSLILAVAGAFSGGGN